MNLMNSKYEKDVERNSHALDLQVGTILAFGWSDWEKSQNTSVRIAGVLAGTYTCRLPKANQKYYHLSQPAQ
jgi:hypothetical protein